MSEIVLSVTPFINGVGNIVINTALSGAMFFVFAIIFSVITIWFYDAKYSEWVPCSIISALIWAVGIFCAVTYFGIFTFKVI